MFVKDEGTDSCIHTYFLCVLLFPYEINARQSLGSLKKVAAPSDMLYSYFYLGFGKQHNVNIMSCTFITQLDKTLAKSLSFSWRIFLAALVSLLV